MERTKYFGYIAIIVLMLLSSTRLLSQQNHRDQIYEAYARGKMDKWYSIMSEYAAKANMKDEKQCLQVINYFYGYTGWLISVKRYNEAEDYIEKSEKIINRLLDCNPDNATVLSYKGAFIAYEIGISSYKAVYLGSRSMKLIERALEIDSENVQAHIEMGNAMFYCPVTFGGDKKVAIEHYKLAVKYMEKQKLTENNWMYLNILTQLGMAYEATEQIQNAKLCYEKIIRIKPNFMWVGEELYPDMLKRYNL